jgi:hypothetical protein
MHVGDDVYILCENYKQAYDLLKLCEEGGLAMNPMKQSIGEYTAEFLRIAYRKNHCIGYVARTIATCVAGNWINDIRLDYKEGLDTVLHHGWTLANRSANLGAAVLLKKSLSRMAHINGSKAVELLMGKSARDGGPCRYTHVDTKNYIIKYEDTEQDKEIARDVRVCAHAATADYLAYHTEPIEQYVLVQIGASVESKMRESSYTKTLKEKYHKDPTQGKRPTVSRETFHVKGMYTIDEAWDKEHAKGLLSGIPILEMMKRQINARPVLLRDLINIVTKEWYDYDYLEELAWGVSGTGCAVKGFLSWADASTIARKCTRQMVTTQYNCYV